MPAQDRTIPLWKQTLHDVIFEADTPAGKAFDVALLLTILLSILFVVLETVDTLAARWGSFFKTAEWVITVLFTVEYGLRLICVRRPWRYATSFFGIVDLLAILPTYLSLLFAGAETLLVIRALRLLRAFRIFKLARFLSEANVLLHAFRASRAKIVVFLTTVLVIVIIMASAMYLVEYDIPRSNGGEPNEGFGNIPQCIYWAIVTLTTVGYGDATPVTVIGKTLAAFMMIIGYSLIIVPTGILSAELVHKSRASITTQVCPECSREGHDIDAAWCKFCGGQL